MLIPTNFKSSKLYLQDVCQIIIPFNDQLLIEGSVEKLTEKIAQRIAPLFQKKEDSSQFSLSNRTNFRISKWIAKILTVWHSKFGLSLPEMNEHLLLLRGKLEELVFTDNCQELNNIVSTEEIYQTATNALAITAGTTAIDTHRLFWNKIRPLIEQGISTEHACFIVLFTAYPNVDLSDLNTSNSHISLEWLYHDLSMIFAQYGFWNLASAAAEKCLGLNVQNGAFTFRDLCQSALKQNEFEKAWLFQAKVQEFNSEAAGQSLMAILKRKIELETDPKSALDQVEPYLIQLLEFDREYGIRCLIAIAKKAVNAQKTEMAVALVERACKEQQTRNCNRERNSDDVHPYRDMARYCLKLKQYELSELFARKTDNTNLFWHLDKIVNSKLAVEIVDDRLIDELHAFRRLRESLVLKIISVLFAQNQLNKARLLLIRHFEGLEEFRRDSLIRQIEKSLQSKGFEVKKWLKEAPEYSQFYSLNDAIEEEHINFLLQNKITTKKAFMIYQTCLETPGVLDFLIKVANQKDRALSPSMLAIKGIGLALSVESLQEQAKQALLQLALVQDRYNNYTLQIQAVYELVMRNKDDFAVQELMNTIITKETREIVQREVLNLHDGLNGKHQEIFNDTLGIRMLNQLVPILNERGIQKQLLYLLSVNKSKMKASGLILEKSLLILFESIDCVLTRKETLLPRSGITPLGYTDTTWDQLYELLLILGFIGEDTPNYETYSQIQEKICSVVEGGRSKNDADAALDALQMINRNKFFKITETSRILFEQYFKEIQPNDESTNLEFRHHIHDHQYEYHSEIRLEYQALLDIISSNEEVVEIKILALRRLCDYAVPKSWCEKAKYKNQVWKFLEELNSKELPDLVRKEITRIYNWRNRK